jgi:hypothetical protein
MAWNFILTDLQGNVHGEVTQATARKVVLPHLRVPSATFTVPINHYLAKTMLDTDCLLKAYRTDPVTAQRDVAFHGPVVSAEETGESGVENIAVTCAGPFWRLSKRIIPSSKLPTGAQYGSEAGLIDLGTIAQTILSEINGDQFTGIVAGSHAASTSGWVGKWLLKNAAEGIAELAAGLNSFEYRVTPTEATTYANPQNFPRIGLFDVAPTLGASKPNAIFEYGSGRANVASYKRTVSREGLLTRAMCSVSGWPDSIEKVNVGTPQAPIMENKYHFVEYSDAAAGNTHGVFEEVVNDAGVLDDALRLSMAQFHINIRKNPRQLITFKPAVNARPAPFVDYSTGDFVRARATVGGSLRFDAELRVWGTTIDIDSNGNESVELELVIP